MNRALRSMVSILVLPLVCAALAALSAPPTLPQSRPGHQVAHRRQAPNLVTHNPVAGNIIGNKRTHVYHLPGDNGALPAEKNRIYFATEAQAQAAGYRLARHGRSFGSTHRPRRRTGLGRMTRPPVGTAPTPPSK